MSHFRRSLLILPRSLCLGEGSRYLESTQGEGKRNEQLLIQWERLKKVLYAVNDQREMRLDDSTKLVLGWLERNYKNLPAYWENPTVVIKTLNSTFT